MSVTPYTSPADPDPLLLCPASAQAVSDEHWKGSEWSDPTALSANL